MIDTYEKQLRVLGKKITQSQIDLHLMKVNNEIQTLTQMRNRLNKEDRLNHANLVQQ